MTVRRPTHSNRAVVLVVVLWVLVVLTALCMALHASVRSRAWQAGRAADEYHRDHAVGSAVAVARHVLTLDPQDTDCRTEPWAAGGEAMFSFSLNEGQVLLLAPSTGPLRWGLADEAARLNANTASAETLAELPSMTLTAANVFVADRDALAAQIAAMDGELAGPAEGLTGPIADRGQLGRLLCAALGQPRISVALAGPDSLWQNPRLWPPQVAEAMGCLSVHSRAWNLDADGDTRVNLNTATVPELTAGLGSELDPLQIQALVLARRADPFQSIGELLTRHLSAPDSKGRTVTVTIPRNRFRRIVDRLTVTDAAVLPGRVNVNTAPAEVLTCLPGLDAALAADLVDHREAIAPPQLRTVGWLLDVLTDDQFRQVASHVTTRSAQFSLLAVAVDGRSSTATCTRATLERRGGRNALLNLERYHGIWDDPR